MANIIPVETSFGVDNSVRIWTWEALTSTNAAGDPIRMPEWADRCVQVVGTFDSATVLIQGSNDGSTWATLSDPQGNAVSFTSAGLAQIVEVPLYLRPSTSGGSSSQDIDVILVARRQHPLRQ